MEKYIGVKIIYAEPMYAHEAYDKGYHRLTEGQNIKDEPNEYGYHVVYKDGYHSWSPAKVFEDAYRCTNELNNTASLMLSLNYKDRFVAEYKQNKIRYERLKNMIDTWDNDGIEGLGFTPTCPREIYNDQLSIMKSLNDLYEQRAYIEQIKLESYD